MAFKGSLDTDDGSTHGNALAVVARFDINYEERRAEVVVDLYHNQSAYDANKRKLDRRVYSWVETDAPIFSDVFNPDAVQLALKDLRGDLSEWLCNLVATRDAQLATWQRVADSKPVRKRTV